MKTSHLPVTGAGRTVAAFTLGIGVSWALNLAWPEPDGDAGKLLGESRAIRTTPTADAVKPSAKADHPPTPRPLSPDRTVFLQRFSADLSAVHAEPDPDNREQRLAGLFARMTEDDIRPAIAFLGQQPPSEFIGEAQGCLLGHWAKTNPRASAFAALETSAQHRQRILDCVMGVWAEESLPDAIVWVQELPDNDARGEALLSIGYEAARTRPDIAVELASSLLPSAGRDGLLAHAVSQWAAQAPETAAAWTGRIDDNGLRRRLQAAVAVAWSDLDPLEAASFVFQSISAGTSQDETMVGIVQRWAQKDPAGVASLVEIFPPGTLRDTALGNLVQLWASQDPGSAGTWLNTLPDGAGRDTAVRAFAEQLISKSPADGFAWAGAIGEQRLRDETLERVGAIWMGSDPMNATAQIARASLAPEARARLLAIRADGN